MSHLLLYLSFELFSTLFLVFRLREHKIKPKSMTKWAEKVKWALKMLKWAAKMAK
jgi:hypothetical protein